VKITAERCEGPDCDEIGIMDSGEEIPYGWLRLRVDEQGGGEILNKIFCSFPCLTQSVLDPYGPSADFSVPQAPENPEGT